MKRLILLLLVASVSASNIFENQQLCTSSTCHGTEKEQLGSHTWFLLHKIAQHTPPTPHNRRDFGLFMDILSKLYPCQECRKHMQELLSTLVVDLSPLWMCKFHNMVNQQLKKEEYDCSKFIEYK